MQSILFLFNFNFYGILKMLMKTIAKFLILSLIFVFSNSHSDQLSVKKEPLKMVVNAVKGEDPYITLSKKENFGETATQDFADKCSHEDSPTEHLKSFNDSVLKKEVFQVLSDSLDSDCVTHNESRTRTEIKQDKKSPLVVTKQGETTTWNFLMQLDPGFKATDSFTHLLQAKAENLNGEQEKQPRLRMSFYNRKGVPTLEFNRADDKGKFTVVTFANASQLVGKWLDISLKTTWSNKGKFEFIVTRHDNGKKVMYKKVSNVDLWNDSWEFMRFKAGIYREYKSPLTLKNVSVRFADFELIKE